ncbi:hypothetical protein [Microbulbifer rhizosphaerae]|uniref:Uncharacterized protein n=1 Tax=Microbulbifer rhizosphaerae TaxID=1562603 RepID=A0A7W4W870_9GAMM|nr:hypothetical protein [Microbulbifer rhizosphaerae]MBB3059274.1 hypothetical protein [Microbulbifer rhizosphaerae]
MGDGEKNRSHSQEAIACLKTYKTEFSEAGKDGSWVLYLQEDLDATNKCLSSMIEIARKDLQVV